MAATVRASYYGASASEPAGATAESGIKWGLTDTQNSATPVQIPQASGTNFSWYKQLALEVTATSATSISNRKVAIASLPGMPSGLKEHFKAGASYVQASGANKPTDDGTTNGVTPSGYTTLTTTPATYDAAGVSAGSAGRNGGFAVVVIGVDNTFAGGAGTATMPDLKVSYDEA